MALEAALGVTKGHSEMLEFVDGWIDETERRLGTAAAVGRQD
jgi:hypothetical protein